MKSALRSIILPIVDKVISKTKTKPKIEKNPVSKVLEYERKLRAKR